MNKKNASKEVVDLFIRVVNKYNSLEKYPVKYGTKHNLYHSERHMIDRIGESHGMNITEFAEATGVTKGAISQVITKLERKGVVRRYKKGGNNKEVLIELTKTGEEVYKKHQKINEESIVPLFEELKKHSDDKVAYLIKMFKWIDEFLELSRKKMEEHAKNGH